MTRGYFTHLITVVFLHGLFFLGSWQLIKNDIPAIVKIESDIMQLKVTSGVFMAGSSLAPARSIVKSKATPLTTPGPSRSVTKTPKNVSQNVAATPSTGVVGATGVAGDTDFSIGSANGTRRATVAELYKAELRARIDHNKYYPALSRRLGQTGTVVIAFTLLEDGNIVNVRIDSPSQFERLNTSALDAVKKVERFKPIPKELGEQKLDIKVPVKFVTI